MNFMLRFTTVVLLLCIFSVARADTLKGPAEARELTNRVMEKVGAGDIEGGIMMTKPYLIIPPAEFEVMIQSLRMQQPGMSQRFGKSIGYEFIKEEKLGESLLRVVQIHKFEKHVMRWSFFFYKGKEGWVLNTFKTDDSIQLLFN